MPEANGTKVWLDFITVFVWQLIVIGCILLFKKDVSTLLSRIKQVDIKKKWLLFHAPESAVSLPNKAVVEEITSLHPGQFLGIERIKAFIADAGLLRHGEVIKDWLQLLDISKQQQLWFVSTNQRLICVLDSHEERKAGTIIKWGEELGSITGVKAHKDDDDRPVVDIKESHYGWAYSRSLHPRQKDLEEDIKCMLEGRNRPTRKRRR